MVLCGPGNNGGDGFVVARLLADAGWPVRLGLLGTRRALKGDAAIMAGRWQGEIEPLGSDLFAGAGIVVDALFGAGLARPVEGMAAAVIEALIESNLLVVAVDIPSGVDGDTGAIRGCAPRAVLTVTFFRRKPGHLLLPGRMYCGELIAVDIGIPDTVLEAIEPACCENLPELWLPDFPVPGLLDHKYSRGHVVITGGAAMTGAARLAARGAMRVGAGMATIASPSEAVAIYAAEMAGVLVYPTAKPADFVDFLADPPPRSRSWSVPETAFATTPAPRRWPRWRPGVRWCSMPMR